MTKTKQTIKKTATIVLSAFLAGTMAVTPVIPYLIKRGEPLEAAGGSGIKDVTGLVDPNTEQFLDPEVVLPLPEGLDEDREISVIVETTDSALLAAYDGQSGVTAYDGVSSFAGSETGKRVTRAIGTANNDALRKLTNAGVKFKKGASYDTLIGGFEVVCKAGEYEKIAKALEGSDAVAYISEEYAECETQIVTNEVDVYDTGIFDSSDSDYDGTGTIVAVLDTGLDYTHSVFDPELFEVADKDLALTIDDLAPQMGDLRASGFSAGLSAADVYINRKVPYGYDYADKDSDVYPLGNEHGTHVAGVIAGNNVGSELNHDGDPRIVGAAPNAQLAIMKVFSDVDTGARWSWILAALEDCVTLDVDVINMSLGSSSGFTREEEGTYRYSKVFDEITAHGISLVAAASNDYNSTFGSEKNGNLGLTSNPDSATVGSPGSYDSALAVASISGTPTPYLTYDGKIIYFKEASDAASEPKDFVEDLFSALPAGTTEHTYDYVTIPGIGRSADYQGIDVQGKIALVRRGSNTFEDKARVAAQQGAAGLIIYNNVSGDIAMNVGFVDIAVCSLSKDDGEMLRAAGEGQIKISRDQVAGPFMSDFSSWGPTPDLRIKPEITAHGGDILSAVPGQAYDRLSGTSMASPNQAGVTALMRQYVKDKFGLGADDAATRQQVLGIVNRLMMCTADIAKNTNNLPYSVRKQGAGLANLTAATTTPAYIETFDRDTGEIMDKAKVELGDDAEKSGVYEFSFNIVNALGEGDLTYDVNAIVMTEGVSETKTEKGDTTVTEDGYLLGASLTVEGVTNGTADGNKVTVGKGQTATVKVCIRLTDADRQYLESSFANGMYVEGYVTLDAAGGVSLNVPYLAFYGDWTQAPLFDIDFFETNKDELDDSLDLFDKTLPDAYATRPLGGLTLDYISYLGAYYFRQPAGSTKIAADRKYISLTNQEDGVNSIYAVWAGMLRGAKRVEVTITDTTTGEVIFHPDTIYNQRKSYNSGGSIRQSSIEIDFSVAEHDLKNNTKYDVRIEAYLDYGEDGGKDTNLRNVFEFPFVTDFEAPSVTDCEFYTEYDSTTKKNRLFARVSIYDNHYSMAYSAGFGKYADPDSQYIYQLDSFNSDISQIYSDFNSTSTVTIELTDYLTDLRESKNKNTFYLAVYDYAMNTGIFEIPVPDDISAIYFEEQNVTLSPNQLYPLSPKVYPADAWAETLEYESTDEGVVRVVNGSLLAIAPGTATVTAYSAEGNKSRKASFEVKVLSETEEGYVRYDAPLLESFRIAGYKTDKAFYRLSSSDREIGITGSQTIFPASVTAYELSMFPSEQVTVQTTYDSYYPSATTVEFESNNTSIVTANSAGQITAVAEGVATVSVRVRVNNMTALDRTITITVKDPYERSGPYLTAYRGLGGKVEIPEALGLTEISQYAFSQYEYIEKGPGDEISEEDPSATKPWFIGEDSITEVVIPEGVETIGAYAFAALTNLKTVTLPSTLTKIAQGAFYGCKSLTTVNGLEHVKFISQYAFGGYDEYDDEGELVEHRYVPLPTARFDSVIAIGNNAFEHSSLTRVDLPATAQSIGSNAFASTRVNSVTIRASLVKVGAYAFADCKNLTSIDLNASVIPEGVFDGDERLSTVKLGKDVTSVGTNAFRGTNVSSFTVDSKNAVFAAHGYYLTSKDGAELKLVAPKTSASVTIDGVTKVGDSAFSGNTTVTSVSMPAVTEVGKQAFAYCTNLQSATFGTLTKIGEEAFRETGLRSLPDLSGVADIPTRAFYGCRLLTAVNIADSTSVGSYAFANCTALQTVTIGNNVAIGSHAFYVPNQAIAERGTTTRNVDGATTNCYYTYYTTDSRLNSLTIGSNANIGSYAFAGAVNLQTATLHGGVIGDRAFYNCVKLKTISFDGVTKIGRYAFAGDRISVYTTQYDRFVGYYETSRAPVLTEANLTSLAKGGLGEGAFANATSLESVTLSDEIVAIPAHAFENCTALTTIDLANITSVGADAFAATKLASADLSSAETVGAGAFADTDALLSATFREEGFRAEDGAFENSALATATDLGGATYVGARAFKGTALSGSLDLTAATYLGDFAFAETGISGVSLSGGLTDIGENPFAGCAIPLFSETHDIRFPDENGQVVDTETIYTFDIGNIKVIDGALYRAVPKGYELICYPMASGEEAIDVPEGTVRIGAQALRGAKLTRAILPLSLRAIGDKAFYECNDLVLVVFKSLAAPILEEQYDETYAVFDNLPGPSAQITIDNLGIYKYAMWNMDASTYFYGANFQDYIGKTPGKLVMVRPKNGTNYESFVYGQYFTAIVDGAVAPDETTLAAIAAIAALPDSITLADEPAVVEARRLYDLIATDEQRALVTNYDKLVDAERVIAYLKQSGEPEPEPPKDSGVNKLALILGIVGGVLGGAAIIGGVALYLNFSKKPEEEGEQNED